MKHLAVPARVVTRAIDAHPHPAAIPPMPAVARILARYDRRSLEAFLSVAIDLLDTMDGDPDIERNGDENDGSFAEDEYCASFFGSFDGPGCPISDPGGGNVEDEGEEEEDGAGQIYATLPVYGVDQSVGPLNEAAAYRAHMEEMLRH